MPEDNIDLLLNIPCRYGGTDLYENCMFHLTSTEFDLIETSLKELFQEGEKPYLPVSSYSYNDNVYYNLKIKYKHCPSHMLRQKKFSRIRITIAFFLWEREDMCGVYGKITGFV
jgi:hypothetical protein